METVFKSLENMTYHRVHDMSEGYRFLEQETADLIILDYFCHPERHLIL